MVDYGDDFGGALDIDPTLSVVSGPQCLLEAVARRWLDLAGSLFYDRDYGAGVEAYLSASMLTTSDITSVLEAEALKDERVTDCAVRVTASGETLTISGQITDSDGESFPLTVVVSQLDVKVLMEASQ